MWMITQVRDQTIHHGNTSYHWFHTMAVFQRALPSDGMSGIQYIKFLTSYLKKECDSLDTSLTISKKLSISYYG